jgi:hypothetical protein
MFGKRIACVAAASLLLPIPYANAVTYTVEPWDFDGVIPGISVNLTQQQLGGSLCPCTKIPYPATGLNNQQGVNAIAATPLQSGDVVVGVSNGSAVISTYLAQNKPPTGVKFILLGDTASYNAIHDSIGDGVPADIGVPVTLVAREYDGWSDFPDNVWAPGYLLAVVNATTGALTIHDYRTVTLNDPANVVATQGNITTVMIPTPTLPINNWLRVIGLPTVADTVDAVERPLIDAAYTRPAPPVTTTTTVNNSVTEPQITTNSATIASQTSTAATNSATIASTAATRSATVVASTKPSQTSTAATNSATVVASTKPSTAATHSATVVASTKPSQTSATNSATVVASTKPSTAATNSAVKSTATHSDASTKPDQSSTGSSSEGTK